MTSSPFLIVARFVRTDACSARVLERVRRAANAAAEQPAEPPGPHTSRAPAPCATRRCARAIRPMAPWWCATASSSAKAATTSCCTAIRPPIPSCWRYATPRAGLARATCRDCDVYSTAMPVRDVPGRALLGTHPPRVHRGRRRRRVSCRGLAADADFRQALRGEKIRHRQRPPHGLYRRRRGRRDRVPARQSDLVLSLA